jgi:uncharacterized protein YegP (UPF0339 family)
MLKFYIYQDKAHFWRWRLRRGSRIIADGGEGYASKSNVLRAVHRIVDTFTTPSTRIFVVIVATAE